jgi:DNA-3-methyladenine glycosylase II
MIGMASDLQSALSHLKSNDEKLGYLIDFLDIKTPKKAGVDFHSLVRIIISQQLSGKAADTIFNRLLSILNVKYIKLDDILNVQIEKLRTAGISYSKCEYIASLATFLNEHPKFFSELDPNDPDFTIDKLISLRGVGRWSASIFAMTCLGMENILPKNDATLMKAIEKLYGEEMTKEKNLNYLFQKWTPHNSIACRVLWTWADINFYEKKS